MGRRPARAISQARYRELSGCRCQWKPSPPADDPRTPIEARLALARFLVGSGLGYEAIGVVNALVDKTPSLQGEPELRGLRGAARASIGRLEEAAADFSAGSPGGRSFDPGLAGLSGRRTRATGSARDRPSPPVPPSSTSSRPEWRARFGTAHALAALETGDLDARARSCWTMSSPGCAGRRTSWRRVWSRPGCSRQDGRSDTRPGHLQGRGPHADGRDRDARQTGRGQAGAGQGHDEARCRGRRAGER